MTICRSVGCSDIGCTICKKPTAALHRMGTIVCPGNRDLEAYADCTAVTEGRCKSVLNIDDLDMQVMVANIRCAEIMEEQLRCLAEDQAWVSLRKELRMAWFPTLAAEPAPC